MFQSLADKLENAFKKFKGKGKLTESDVKEGMREIKLALLEADVNFKVVKEFMATVSERCVGAEVLESLTPTQHIVKIVNEELTRLMGGSVSKLQISSKPPTVVLMAGLQGAGKTTNCGKLQDCTSKRAKDRCWLPAIFTVRRPSGSCRWWANSWASRCLPCLRAHLRWRLPEKPWSTQSAMRTIWFSSIRQDGCTSMKA